jgi:phage-related holin
MDNFNYFCRFFHGQSFNYIMLILFILVIDQINKIFRTHWIRRYRSNWFRVLIYLLRIIFLIVISIVISHLDLEKIYSVSIIYCIYCIYCISIIIAIIFTEPGFELRLYVPDNDEEKQVSRPNFNKPIEVYIFANRGKEYRYLGIIPLEYIKEKQV